MVDKLGERAERYRELEALLMDPEVASDHKRFPALLRERGQLEESARLKDRLDALVGRRAEAQALVADERGDAELVELAREELRGLEEEEHALDAEIKNALVIDEDLARDKVIVEIRAGTGGDEATLFARNLFDMYASFIERRRWKSELLEAKSSEVGGFKEVIFAVQGEGVWRLFRFETGGHRVQRVPETESQGRIHTSAATVAVLPEAEEVDIDLRTEDLRIDTMRASGAGGQHVNKTESAVRITHIPTGVVVTCMDEKSQHKNKARALRILRTRLFELERQRLHDERAEKRRSQVGSGDRSQRVRTYNFPQNRVSDHRLGENFSLEQVINGRLDPILAKLEEKDREERIRNL
ncbi:MAG: peptide chain release factor 1 [Planctomycetota bacterium]|nr:peptide chain release factor 1 [Planctomycetota bacterium]